MQPTFADFEVSPPHDHGVRATVTGSEFRDGRHMVRPGGRVDLVGFTVTTEPRTDLTVVVRGCAEPTARNVPVRISVNGTQVLVLQAVPALDNPAESRITVPAGLLTRGSGDALSLSVDPGADGAFCLWHILLNPADRVGQSEQARREIEHFDTCPAKELSGGSLEADRVVAAARRHLAGTSPGAVEQRRAVGAALRHLLLAHGFTERPGIARAIVELVPEQAPLAVGQLARFLNDPVHDPSAQGDWYVEHTPGDYERLCTVLALAALDRSYLDAAAQAYRVASPFEAAVLGADFAMLGPSQRETASERLRHLAASTRADHVATDAVRALLRIGQFELVLSALKDFADRGMFLAQVARPLSAADPAVRPALVDSALRALAANPGHLPHLAVRGVGGPGGDVASEVLACGPGYGDRVAETLWRLVNSHDLSADVRWRAAHRLGLVAASEHEAAVRALTDAGVYDPEAPRPQRPADTEQELAAAHEAASAVWQRIEHELARRFPSFPVSLGAPAIREQITACEDALSLRLPVEFAASCMVHRSVAFGISWRGCRANRTSPTWQSFASTWEANGRTTGPIPPTRCSAAISAGGTAGYPSPPTNPTTAKSSTSIRRRPGGTGRSSRWTRGRLRASGPPAGSSYSSASRQTSNRTGTTSTKTGTSTCTTTERRLGRATRGKGGSG